MPMYLIYNEPPWLRPAIQPILDPGEVIEILCDFYSGATNRTLVLTNRTLRFTAFQRPRFAGKKPWPLTFNFTIPLHLITGVGVSRVPPGLRTQAKVSIQVHWTGTPEFWSSNYAHGDLFAQHLEGMLARRTAAAQGSGIADEIAKLGALTSNGVITAEEFERGKQVFLGSAPDQAAATVAHLRQLHDLFLAKVLSESEFNMKKWELLSKP